MLFFRVAAESGRFVSRGGKFPPDQGFMTNLLFVSVLRLKALFADFKISAHVPEWRKTKERAGGDYEKKKCHATR